MYGKGNLLKHMTKKLQKEEDKYKIAAERRRYNTK
jgi:hypothetical protein